MRMTNIRWPSAPALLWLIGHAADIAPSPITATTFTVAIAERAGRRQSRARRNRGRGMRRAKGIVGTFRPLGGSADRPPSWRRLAMASRRRVRILWALGLVATSQISLSRGVSKTAWMATVSSMTPRVEPRCPPVARPLAMVSRRSSSASLTRSYPLSRRSASGFPNPVRAKSASRFSGILKPNSRLPCLPFCRGLGLATRAAGSLPRGPLRKGIFGALGKNVKR